jgi:hypothetical protein
MSSDPGPGAPDRAGGPDRAAPVPDRAAPVPETATGTGPAAWARDDPAFEARVIRAFVRDGRLTSIPARERKKLVVYRYLIDRVFPDPAEVVHERDVNMRLALWHPDVATIRRALADLGFVRRDGMAYRRAVPIRTDAG